MGSAQGKKKILDVFGFSYYRNKDNTIQKVCNFDDFDFSKTPFSQSQSISEADFNSFCKLWDIKVK